MIIKDTLQSRRLCEKAVNKQIRRRIQFEQFTYRTWEYSTIYIYAYIEMIIGRKGLVDLPPRPDGDRWAAGRGAWGRARSACRGANVSWHRRQYHVYPDHRQVRAGAPYPSVSVPPALAHGRRQFHCWPRRKRRQRCYAACCWPAASEVA